MALQEFLKALNNADEIELTVTGRSSGRPISRPVWFVQEGGTLYLLPVTGGDSRWYQNVLKTPAITREVRCARDGEVLLEVRRRRRRSPRMTRRCLEQ
jgi:hypothetical protein